MLRLLLVAMIHRPMEDLSMDDAMPLVERKVISDCVCRRTKKGTVKLCLYHDLKQWLVRESVTRRYSRRDRRGDV